jgi:molybdate transport system substrate-binding protein
MRTSRGAALAVLGLALPLAACAQEKDDAGGSGSAEATPAPVTTASASPTAAAGTVTGTVTVYAASSLTESFEKLKAAFEAKYPGTEVTFQFGSSATLATQITQGAPADVFAAASPATMTTVQDAGDVDGAPTTFVRNRLEIAVPADNPGDVTGLSDFTKEDLTIALCEEAVPCGSAAKKLFEAVSITPVPDTRQPDVKSVLSKVELGEVDLALVYHTDVLSAPPDKVRGIAFPESDRAVNDYPIAVLAGTKNRDTARAWVDFVLSAEGDQVLKDAGFEVA